MSGADEHPLGRIYAQTYAEASGQPVELVREWMRSESWLSPEDAVALGFADAIEAEPAPQTAPAPERQTETTRALAALAAQPNRRPVATFAQPVMTL